jgi:hypothetical protein
VSEEDELRERLRKAREKVAANEGAEAVAASARVLREEVALEEAKAEHGGKVAVVETAVGRVIVKRPNSVYFRRYMDAGSTKSEDLEKLVRHCLVHPDRDRLDRILEEQPGALLHLVSEIHELAGIRAKEVSGKS